MNTKAITFKLVLEGAVFNILMYWVMMTGVFAAAIADILGANWRPSIYPYAAFFGAMGLYGGALGHYFLHQAAAYNATLGEDDIKKYENDRSQYNISNSTFVGGVNAFILIGLTSLVANSIYHSFLFNDIGEPLGAGLAGFYILGLLTFVFAPKMAKMGWSALPV